MSQLQKLLLNVLSGQGDQSIAFADWVKLLTRLSFDMRTKGSHHIFTMPGVNEIINMQPRGAWAKPYQTLPSQASPRIDSEVQTTPQGERP